MIDNSKPEEPSPLRAMGAHNNLHGVLFNATSAEYYALTIQCYQLARHALLERLSEGTFLNPAVIMDLDETVLDNSAFQAWLIQSGHNFHDATSWDPWCNEGIAEAVPGSVEFVRFARAKGAEVIFITSRSNKTREGTARNLHMLGLLNKEEFASEQEGAGSYDHALGTRLFMAGMPQVDVERPSGTVVYGLKNKFQQRRFCEEIRNFEVTLSIGDNLSDWGEYYGRVYDCNGNAIKDSHPTVTSRRQSAIQDSQLFGRDFVLLPNATYGGWVRALEGQGIGASDELAYTGSQVREALIEPQEEFRYPEDRKKATGPKLASANLTIWKGPFENGDA